MTVGAMRAISEARLSIPDDIAVIGFDALAIHTRNYPNLSTLSQSIPNLGRTAVELLLKRIADPDSPAENVYLRTNLLTRGSCGCGAPAGPADRGFSANGLAPINLLEISPAMPARV
jgi:LacI family transcriptional regulator